MASFENRIEMSAFSDPDFEQIYKGLLKLIHSNTFGTDEVHSQLFQIFQQFDFDYQKGLEAIKWLFENKQASAYEVQNRMEDILIRDDGTAFIYALVFIIIMEHLVQNFAEPDIMSNLDKKDLRWGRVLMEKVYFDVFSNRKTFQYNLLKYLQKDGKSVILPEIKAKEIS